MSCVELERERKVEPNFGAFQFSVEAKIIPFAVSDHFGRFVAPQKYLKRKKSFCQTQDMVDSVTTECSSTTPHLGGREDTGSGPGRRTLTSGGSTSVQGSMTRPNFPGLMAGSHHHHGQGAQGGGIWDLTNTELGYELAATSGN